MTTKWRLISVLSLVSIVAANPTDTVSITVDATKIRGPFNEKVLAVGGPDKRLWWAGNAQLIRTLSEAKIKMVRIGPAQTGLYTSNQGTSRDLYPKPHGWVWNNVDPIMQTIFDSGAEPLYLVNGYPGGVPSYKSNGQIPTTAGHWAEYARFMQGIVKHFNVDKALGPNRTIKYWEMWNEPEIEPDGKLSKEAYKAFFETVGRAMKETDPTIQLLGPTAHSYRFAHHWISWARENLSGLDLVSWHQYAPRWGSDEARMATNTPVYRDAVVLERAFGKGVAITEYHLGSMSNRVNYSNEFAAAFLGSALVNAIQGGVEIFSVFTSYHPWENSLLDGDFLPLRSFYPYYLLGNFHGDTLVSSTGGNPWVEHVATTSQVRGETYLMVVNKDTTRREYQLNLTLQGMAFSGKVIIRKVDGAALPHEATVIPYTNGSLSTTLTPYSVTMFIFK